MAIFLVYSTSGIASSKKVCRELKMAAIFKILKYQTQLQFDLRYENIFPNYVKKGIFMMMTSSMTSQGGLKVGPLYSFIYEITRFFMITKQRAKISSLNFLCICIIRLWLQLYEYIFMTSLMTSPGHKIGQILKLIYLRQYLNYSVDQKLKMSEMLMAIFLVYSTSSKKSLSGSKWRPFWKFWNIKHSFNLTSDMKRSSQILKLIYLRQYLNYSVDQKLKMSEMLMAIFLVYLTSGITSSKKVCRELKMAAILKILKY